MSKTEWMPATIKPVRTGWYEVTDDLHHNSAMHLHGTRRLWDGKKWCAGWLHESVSIFGLHQSHKWRGLTKEKYEEIKRLIAERAKQ